MLYGSAINLAAEINALKNAEIPTPARTNTSIPLLLYDLDIIYVMETDMIPNINANICINTFPIDRRMAILAPNPAPFATPKRAGDTRGFLKYPEMQHLQLTVTHLLTSRL